MKTINLLALLFSLALLTLVGCGGGGGGGGTAATSSPTASGVASKGLIKNGHYQAFQIFSSQTAHSRPSSTPFFEGDTDLKGNYSIPIPASMSKDGLYVKVTSGTYTDEATQSEKSVATEYPAGMRAAFGNMSGIVRRGGNLQGCITPFTEMAVRAAGPGLDDNSVKAGKSQIEHAFGLDNKGVDITHTQPLDPSVAPAAGSDDRQKAYTNALGIISQYENDNAASGKKLGNLSDDLIAEIHSNGGLLTVATQSSLDKSELNYDNGGNNHTGVVPVSVLPSLALSTSKSAAISNGSDSVTISATVQISGAPASGLEVTFTLKSGAGTLSQKSVLSNASGVASTGLTSTVDGDADIVTVSVGGVTKDTAAINFADPNKPASIVLVANPGSGTTQANGFVTLSATVSPAASSGVLAATPVSFTITSGSGTLSAASATTSGGVATVTLSAATANLVSVSAKVGTAVTSNTVSVNFINQPTRAIIKISSTGVPAGVLVGGLHMTLTLPAGVTVRSNADGSTATGVVVTSGTAAATGALSVGNGASAGTVGIVMATTVGFAGGEFVTVNADVAPGTFTGSFGVVLAGSVFDTAVQPIAGVGLSSLATFQ